MPTERSHSSPQVRYEALKKASDEILAGKEELGRLLAREEGKILAEGIGEVARAGQIFAFFAGEALRIAGEKVIWKSEAVGSSMVSVPGTTPRRRARGRVRVVNTLASPFRTMRESAPACNSATCGDRTIHSGLGSSAPPPPPPSRTMPPVDMGLDKALTVDPGASRILSGANDSRAKASL
jgi:hypothetical protein